MNDTSINAFNLKIRQTEWYQQWFRSRGLNPNRVKLSDAQREDLKRVVEQQTGFRLPGDMKIDPAGNLNEKGGWAGLPTGVKIAIIGGAALATGGALGAFGGAAGGGAGASGTGAGLSAAGNFAGQAASPLMMGSGTLAGVSSGAAAVPIIASTAYGSGMGVAPSLAGSTAAGPGSVGSIASGVFRSGAGYAGNVPNAPAAAGIGMRDVLMGSLAPGINAGANYFSNRAASRGAREAAELQTQSVNYAADLEAKAAQEQLDFLREQEARRRQEFDETQARNHGIYLEERDYDRGLYSDRQKRLQPYRDFAIGSLGHLSRPIKNIPQAGSIGARVRS